MRRPLLFVCVCLFVILALGMQLFMPPPWNSETAVSVEETVHVEGSVYDKEYGQRNGREVLIVYLQDILISGGFQESRQNTVLKENLLSFFNSKPKMICEIYVSDLPCLKEDRVYLPCLGDRIEVIGEWSTFQNATNPGEFDPANYYAIDGISGRLAEAKIVSKIKAGVALQEELYRLRKKLVERLYYCFEMREASILAKMLLGDGEGLDPEISKLYRDNGIVHILSISGLHISLLGMGLYSLLRRMHLPLVVAAVLGGFFIVLYGMLTGFSVSACRAIGMYLIHMLGEVWGKTYDMLTAMGVLLIGMFLRNPKLAYHSGFLLSFASVCGVGLLGPVLVKGRNVRKIRPYDSEISKWFKKRTEGIRSGLLISLAVTMFTLPLQLFFFYQIPVYSVFLNLLVIPFVGVAMVIGLLVLMLPFASFLAPIEGLIFDWFEGCCLFFEKLPGNMLVVGRPPFLKIVIYYAGLLGGIYLAKRIKRKWVVGILSICTLFLIITDRQGAEITFLDVGQGDCICVQTDNGKCFLFDGGSSSKYNVGNKIIRPFLQYEGIRTVDGVFLSHPDADHMNGILQLLQEGEISVKNIFLPDVAGREKEFEEILNQAGKVNVQYVSENMCLEFSDLKVTCLHPPKGYAGEDNSYSACYFLELNNSTVLLTGDIEGEGEQILTKKLERLGIQNVDILKVAHHGSRNSTSEDFLEQVNPVLAVISCGRESIYGHPHQETLFRLEEIGSKILITAKQGAITIRCEKK